jgi:probable HAF family extracellular repeat protein
MSTNMLRLLVITVSSIAYSTLAGATTTLFYNYDRAYSINNAGQVVGESHGYAAIWSGNSTTILGTERVRASRGHVINDAGLVAGQFLRSDPAGYAAVFNGVAAIPLATLGGAFGYASGINNAGQIVGWSEVSSPCSGCYGNQDAVLWHGTTATALVSLGGQSSRAYDINNVGQIVGRSWIAGDTASHATLWDGMVAIDLGTLGGTTSEAAAINDAGRIVGSSSVTGNTATHATLWDGVTAIDLGTLSGPSNSASAINFSYALSINGSGQVVGYGYQYDPLDWPEYSESHAIIWSGATAIDLNNFLDASIASAGWYLSSANAINDGGSIVGYANNRITGAYGSYLLTSAVPEPETCALLLAGLGVITGVARRRISSH